MMESLVSMHDAQSEPLKALSWNVEVEGKKPSLVKENAWCIWEPYRQLGYELL